MAPLPLPSPARSTLFLTLEGIDGAGKSSHIEALEALFRAQGRAVVRTREPGGTPLAETLRHLVLEQTMDALTESLLIFAARREHIQQVIAPALARGAVVICDRFTDATFAYQGAGRGFDTAVLRQLERWVQARSEADVNGPRAGEAEESALLQPDLTLWFDLAPEAAAARLAGTRVPDRFEAQPVEFFRRVSAGYAARAAQTRRFARIDAGQPRDVVWAQIEATLRARGLIDCAE
ncbi:MAG: dTMP kinase [Burkholderiaceae bacterium]|nr:dTMP kinase [Burkholderiaceae bacterium]